MLIDHGFWPRETRLRPLCNTGWMDGWMDAEFGPWFINPITCSQANIENFFATLYCWSHILRKVNQKMNLQSASSLQRPAWQGPEDVVLKPSLSLFLSLSQSLSLSLFEILRGIF